MPPADALRSLPPSGTHRLSRDAPRSPARCAAKAIPVVPGLPLVVFFLRSRRCSYRRRLQCLAPESTSRALFSLAGFQVTLIGRFWVTAEDKLRREPLEAIKEELMRLGTVSY